MIDLKTENCMLDLETVSLANNPGLLSIGACMFNNTEILRVFYMTVDLESCLSVGLDQSKLTMDWWQSQPDDVRKEAFSGGTPLRIALMKFKKWYGKNVPIWSHGAVNDTVWLDSAYKACDMSVPWFYRNVNCYRTMINQFPPDVWVYPEIAHNALEDAIAQAKTLQGIIRKLHATSI